MNTDYVAAPVPTLDTEDRLVYVQQTTQAMNPEIASTVVIEMTYSEALALADWINGTLANERE